MYVCVFNQLILVFLLTIAPGLKSKAPYCLRLPLVVKNCVSKALGLSSARMLILERIFWKDIWEHQQTEVCRAIWLNCLQSASNWKMLQKRYSSTSQLSEEVTLYLKGNFHDLQDIGWVFLQQTNLSNGEILLEFLHRAHRKQKINPPSKFWPKTQHHVSGA